MSETNTNNNGGLYFIVGILVVVVIGIGAYMYMGDQPDASVEMPNGESLSVDIDEDSIEAETSE